MSKILNIFSVRKFRVSATFLVTLTLMVFILNHKASALTTLNFEDLPPGTNVTTQYSGRGVIFPHGSFLDTDPAAHSGTRVLRADNPAKEFHQPPFVIEFTSGQRRVHLFAGTTLSSNPLNGTLRAFDVSGTLIAQDGPKPVAPKVFTTAFEVSAPSPSIRRIELKIGGTEFEAIDDLEFEGEPPPPPPATAPVVRITSPIENAQLDTSTLIVQGTVTGDALLPTATLKVKYGLPPDSTAPPFVSGVQLTGTGTSRTFSVPLGLALGPQVLTIEAVNSGGLKGGASVRFTNLPVPIRERFASQGGQTTFGDFRWGGIDGNCKIAIYERGAIFNQANFTRTVRGEIFTKWLSLRDPGAFVGRLGCPTSEEVVTLGVRKQDFSKGRIYAGLPTGSHYVPLVFVQAIDQLGGEAATGIPIADPLKSLANDTWLFQQFARPGQPGLPSTLEITKNPLMLWVERQGGDLSTLSEAGASLTPNTPTITQGFPCSSNQGPCDLSHSASPVGNPPPHPGHLHCLESTYPLMPGLPEWKPILGQYDLTSMIGIVKDSHMAGEDNPLAHEYMGDAPFFPSDWNILVRPLAPFMFLFGDNTDTVEIEVEYYFVQHFFVNTDFPDRGDLIFTSGRWIFDCGHIPYNTEIHPPSVMALMRTQTYNGRPATEASIWVGGFYPGSPVEIDVFPPPRPSPNASLVVEKPSDSQAAVDINVEDSVPYINHVRIRFTASVRHVPVVDGTGEMKWQTGRGYTGIWHVYWTE